MLEEEDDEAAAAKKGRDHDGACNSGLLQLVQDGAAAWWRGHDDHNQYDLDRKLDLDLDHDDDVDGDYEQELHLPLPFDVAKHIFTLLPFPCIARLRLVCRSWNAILSSTRLLSSLHDDDDDYAGNDHGSDSDGENEVEEEEEEEEGEGGGLNGYGHCGREATLFKSRVGFAASQTKIQQKLNCAERVKRKRAWAAKKKATRAKKKKKKKKKGREGNGDQGKLRRDREWWFVMAAAGVGNPPPRFVGFTPSYGPWHGFRLPHMGAGASRSPGDHLLHRVASSHTLLPSVQNVLVASAAGLICAVVAGPSGGTSPQYDVIVVNCLTGSFRPLPRPLRLASRLISSCRISMSSSATPPHYRIIVSDSKYRDLEVYDPARRGAASRWAAGADIRGPGDGDVALPDLIRSDLIRYRKGEIAAYDAGPDKWRKAHVAEPNPELCLGSAGESLVRSTAVKAGGKILLVACLMREGGRIFQGFGIWELRARFVAECPGRDPAGPRYASCGEALEWVHVARTPPHVLAAYEPTAFRTPALYDCRFVGATQCGCVCLTGAHYAIGGGQEDSTKEPKFWPPLIYHLPSKEWVLLPPYKHSSQLLCLFPFEPRFNAMV